MQNEKRNKNNPSKYVSKDKFEGRCLLVDERCESHEAQIQGLRNKLRKIDQKITASLVFVIATLVAILTALGVGVLG
jgi:hypothetical protein